MLPPVSCWGGEEPVEGSVPGSDIGAAVDQQEQFFLPKTHSIPWLEEEFNLYVVQREFGPARKFAVLHRDDTKTETAPTAPVSAPYEGVWQLGPDVLWKFMPFATWATTVVQPALQADAEALVAAIKAELDNQTKEVREAEDVGREDVQVLKAIAAAWRKALMQAQAALTYVSLLTSVRHIATVAATLLEDKAFFDGLDSRRDILSFQNGVVFLDPASAPLEEEHDVVSQDVEARPLLLRQRQPTDYLSYALPYSFDASADVNDVQAFVDAVISDPPARAALQTHVGYWATGATTEKRFYQLSTLPNSGKTTFLNIIACALGAYVSCGNVPVHELTSSCNFEDTLSSELAKRPTPRCIIFDETSADCELKEEFINLATSGAADIRLSCRLKHRGAQRVHSLQGPFVFSSNHTLNIKASSTGTAFRNTSPPFDATFLAPEAYRVAVRRPHIKQKDEALCARLMSDAGRAAVALWIVQGARRFYTEGIVRCSAWERYALTLLTRGDAHLRWVSEHYTPTGSVEDKVATSVLVEQFTSGSKGVASRKAEDAIKAALSSISDLVVQAEWEAPPLVFGGVAQPAGQGVLVQGFTGLRPKRFGDLAYFDSIEAARTALAAAADDNEDMAQVH